MSEERGEIIELLRGNIQRLEVIVDRLNRESSLVPSMATVESLIATTEKLAASLEKTQGNIVTRIQSESPSTLPLEKINPPSKLPSSVLTALVGGLIFILTIFGIFVLPSKQPETEISENLPVIEEIEQPQPTVDSIEISEPENTSPSQNPEEVTPLPSPTVVEQPKLPPPLIIPDQSLIAAIQTQVSEITTKYSENLIQSIEANFRSGLLRVTLGDDWYQLSEAQKLSIANEILQRSRLLDFRKLELINTERTILARSPVVGQNMVLLQPS